MAAEVLEELAWRGLIFQRTHEEELDELLSNPGATLYCGFDPSSDSMQVGNLLMIVALARFRRAGHNPIALAGGATGLIGDPSGKSSERTLLTVEEIAANTEAIGEQLRTILDRAMTLHTDEVTGTADDDIPLVNNADWMTPWSYIEFLRDVGKNFRVNAMLAKDSVKSRIENRDQGISYTEFSYQVIQAYDFLHLHRERDCVLQIGGSDQWGNITAGTDLIRRHTGEAAFGLTLPLITDASGNKFGKSEGGAIYLSPEKTSPYAFYQYWVNQDDEMVIDLLKKYTFLSQDHIGEMEASIERGENRGEVQQTLAYELTQLVHGTEEADKVVRASRMLFGEKIEGLSDKDLAAIFSEVPTHDVQRAELESGIDAVNLFADAFSDSRGAMRRLLDQGGGYVNNEKLEDGKDAVVTLDHLTSETKLVLRAGKKRYCVVTVTD